MSKPSDPKRCFISTDPGLLWMKLAAITAFAAVAGPVSAQVRYAGSDTVAPVLDAAAVAFVRGHAGFKLPMQATGTAPGLRDLCAGRAMLVGASRAIKGTEAKDCAAASVHYTELPIAMDAVVLVVPISNDWLKDLKVAEAKALFDPASAGKLMSWHQLRPAFPDLPIHAAGVGIKHSTFTFFSEGVGLNGFIRSDYKDFSSHPATGKYVAGETGGIGFMPLGDALAMGGQVRVVPLDFGAGPVMPSAESVQSGRYDRLARMVYLYVNQAQLAKQSPQDIEFVHMLSADVEKFVRFANLVPLLPMQYRETARRMAP